MDKSPEKKITRVKSSDIKKSIDDFLATVYPYAKDADERVRMYVRRVNKVRIPFGSINAKYGLNTSAAPSHFQNSLAAMAFPPIPDEVRNKIHDITYDIVERRPFEISFQPREVI